MPRGVMCGKAMNERHLCTVNIWEGVTLLDLSSNSEGRMESIPHTALFVTGGGGNA